MFQGIFKSAINDANKNYIFGTGSIPINIKVANLETFAKAENKQQGYQVAEVNKLISTMLTGWDANGNKPKSMSDNYLELILSCDNGFVVKKRLQFPHIIAWQDDNTPYNIADVYKQFSIDNWLKADDFENPDITLVVEPTDEILTTSTANLPEVTTTNSGRFYLYYRNLPVGINRVHIDFHIKTQTEPIDFDLEIFDGLSYKDAQTILASDAQAKINVLLSGVKDVYNFTGAEGNFENITMHEWNALYQQIISLKPNNKFTHDLFFVLYVSEIETEITELEQKTIGIEENIEPISVTIRTVDNVNGYWHAKTGAWVSDNSRKGTEKIDVLEGEKYLITTNIGGSTVIGYLAQWNGDTYVGVSNDFKGGSGNAVDREYIVPDGVTKIAICSYNTTSPSLKKVILSREFKAYTKEESDDRYAPISIQGIKRYGVKWSITDAEDLGARCFDAVGLSAEIAIGSGGGHSDFDNIYPWSEMKRCNISLNDNGAKIVTLEGEIGFALDGSNGDVFVRIPKFSVEKYVKNGEEYRVISNDSRYIHPAFIEDGKVLDEIFISAFEASENEGKLYSKGGVIPANNITAETFLNYAKSKGVCYSLFDNRCVDLLFSLMSVEFGCRNSNKILGYGYSGYLQAVQHQLWSHCSISSPSTNTITLGKPSSNAERLEVLSALAVGQNICICGNAQDGSQSNILAQRKITSISCPTENDNFVVGFEGEPIAVDAEIEGSKNYTYVGNAPSTCNNCETISDAGAAMTYHTGRTNRALSPIGGIKSETANTCRYRWIENPIGNVWHFLPDVTFVNGQMYVCENMRDYVCHKHISPYKPIGKTLTPQISNGNKNDITGVNYWISSLINDIFAKGYIFGNAWDVSLVSTKAFGAYYYLSDAQTPVIIAHGGGYDHLYRCNILTQRAWIVANQRWYSYGARLMFKNIA